MASEKRKKVVFVSWLDAALHPECITEHAEANVQLVESVGFFLTQISK